VNDSSAPDTPASGPAPAGGREPQAPDGIHRVLLVADERFHGTDFVDELRSHLEGGSGEVELFVVTPSLAGSGIEHEMADFDGPIVEARERLDWIITELKSVGIAAIGEVGDGDPTVAVGDGLREFPADEIIVVGHAEGQGRSYSEKDLWSHLKRDFAQPVTALMVGRPVDGEHGGEVVDIKHSPAKHHADEDGIVASRNFPPLGRRDIAGIMVGVLGTLALGLITVASGVDNPSASIGSGDLSGRTAAIMLIAIGAFLLNVAHVVGLIFFQSVRYEGIWSKFLYRVAMAYTTIGLVAALILWLA
jgi:hypothetical protein